MFPFNTGKHSYVLACSFERQVLKIKKGLIKWIDFSYSVSNQNLYRIILLRQDGFILIISPMEWYIPIKTGNRFLESKSNEGLRNKVKKWPDI